MYRVFICDDNYDLCVALKKQLKERYGDELLVSTFENTEALLWEVEEHSKGKNVPDIVLMDIDVNGTNGITFVEKLLQKYSSIKVIFITGHIDFATEIFKVDPSYFLVKPIEPARLEIAMNKVMLQIEEKKDDWFLVNFKGKVHKVNLEDIIFVESKQRTAILHTRKGEYTVYKKLDDMESELPDYFLRCHQSYLVNMNEIGNIQTQQVELLDGTLIPVSRNKYKQTKDKFMEYIGSM